MEKQFEDIKAIREMMEKSTRCLTLSGLSGIIAGFFAIVGASFAYYVLRAEAEGSGLSLDTTWVLFVDAFIVLLLSIASTFYFSVKLANRKKQQFFNTTTKRALYNLSLPLLVGAILSIIFLVRGEAELIAATTLIFYGLGLINASKYTFEEVHYLGIIEVVLGLLAAIFLHKGLIFWTIGFGVCHIIYGIILYKKYDRK